MSRRALLAGGAGFAAATMLSDLLPTPAFAAPVRGRHIARDLGTTGPIFGAELQYFRMTPASIRKRLELCRQASYSVIQAYVPWNVHENTKGRLDWTGKTHPVIVSDHADEYQIETPDQEIEAGGLPSRVVANTDLHGFMTMCRDFGFQVILRPGPFISDEWRNGGLPDWFLDAGFPDMFMRGPDGSVLTPGAPFSPPLGTALGGGPLFYFPSPSYASSTYLEGSRRWLRSFATFARPWLVTNGGPVIGVQVDDETCYFYRFGAFEVDYHPSMLKRWSAATHGATAPRSWPPTSAGIAALRPALRWQTFKAQQVAGYLGALADDLRDAHIDVPITHETELSLTPSGDFTDDARSTLVTPEFYSGGASLKTLPANELTAQAARAASRHRGRPWATEMNNGDIGLYQLLAGEGVIGGLQFTYTEGVPDGAGDDLGRLGRVFKVAGRRLADARRRADIALVWDNRLTYFPYDTQARGFATDVNRTVENHVPAAAELLVRAGYAFDLLDVHAAAPADYGAYPVMVLVGTEVMPRKAQDVLVRYVRQGGRLICWPTVPSYDSDLHRYDALARHCFSEPVAAHRPADSQAVDLLGHRVRLWRGVRTYRLGRSATPIASVDGHPCGYRRRVGHGEAIMLGGMLAADSPIGRQGEVFEEQQLPSGSAARVAALNTLARKAFGPAADSMVAVAGEIPAGAQSLIAYQYSNERRGGEVVSGGVLAAWDGQRSVGLAELNTAETARAVTTSFPRHLVLDEHNDAVRRLLDRHPQVRVSDRRVQARVLDAPERGTATVMALNRSESAADVVLHVSVAGHEIRLPRRGSLRLPSGAGLLMPIGYHLEHGVVIRQATCEITGVHLDRGAVEVSAYSPAGGELIASLHGNEHRIETKPGEHRYRLR